MKRDVTEGKLLWSPSKQRIHGANITRYMAWLADQHGLHFQNYNELWLWSTKELAQFWRSIWDYFEIQSPDAITTALDSHAMPGARFFPGIRLNYAEHALKRRDDHPAIVFQSETLSPQTISYRELHDQVARAAAGLRRLGVRQGDRWKRSPDPFMGAVH